MGTSSCTADRMGGEVVATTGHPGDSDREEEEEEEDFCSCCAEDEEWRETDESVAEKENDLLDEFSLRLFFKGVSASQSEEGSMRSGVSGIGIVMERARGVPVLQVQKKLNLYVEAIVAEHLALMDALLEALRMGVNKVFAFTDFDLIYRQLSEDKCTDDQLVIALGQRILELASKLDVFMLKLVPTSELQKALALAQEASGILASSSADKAFAPIERFCCPFPRCNKLLDPCQLSPARLSFSDQVNSNCVECPACRGTVCMACHVPWHASISCEEYQYNSREGRSNEDEVFQHLVHENSWRQCERCLRVIDLVQGCYHTVCWCGHEFCYSCGSDYRDGQQTCHCAHDEEGQIAAAPCQDPDLWRWDSFELPTSVLDAYTEQERSQLAMIQRFLAGGLSLGDLNPCQSPPRCSDSFVDTIKDLHQLPWLERFVSVISDDYQGDYTQ